MTVYEDWVSKENDGRSGMFNRIEVRDAVVVVPILEDRWLIWSRIIDMERTEIF